MGQSITIPLPAGQSGLTWTAQVRDAAGLDVGAIITTGFTADGSDYVWTYASIPDDFTSGSVAFVASNGLSLSSTLATFSTAAPGRTTGYVTCFDSAGNPAEGVEITIKLLQTVAHSAGLSHDDGERTNASNSLGNAEFPGMLQKTWYQAKRGSGGWTKAFKTGDGPTTALPEILGFAS